MNVHSFNAAAALAGIVHRAINQHFSGRREISVGCHECTVLTPQFQITVEFAFSGALVNLFSAAN